MTFSRVTGKPFYCNCILCAKQMLAGEGPSCETVFADLAGKPFVDYYCAECKRNFELALREADMESLETLEAAEQIYDWLHSNPQT